MEFDLQDIKLPQGEICPFYTFQELLNNTVKYAQSTRAVVCHWQEEKQRVYLQYEDDGIGFDTTAPVYGIGFKTFRPAPTF